jgi:hypothetical protein
MADLTALVPKYLDAMVWTRLSDGIPLRPCAERDPDQEWYWTPEWQEGEKQIGADRAAGRFGPTFDSAGEFLDGLRALADRASSPSAAEN